MRKLLSTTETANLLGLARNTLEHARVKGSGPPFIRLGRRVRYRSEDVEAWVSERRVGSTSQVLTQSEEASDD